MASALKAVRQPPPEELRPPQPQFAPIFVGARRLRYFFWNCLVVSPSVTKCRSSLPSYICLLPRRVTASRSRLDCPCGSKVLPVVHFAAMANFLHRRSTGIFLRRRLPPASAIKRSRTARSNVSHLIILLDTPTVSCYPPLCSPRLFSPGPQPHFYSAPVWPQS